MAGKNLLRRIILSISNWWEKKRNPAEQYRKFLEQFSKKKKQG